MKQALIVIAVVLIATGNIHGQKSREVPSPAEKTFVFPQFNKEFLGETRLWKQGKTTMQLFVGQSPAEDWVVVFVRKKPAKGRQQITVLKGVLQTDGKRVFTRLDPSS